MLHGQKTRTKEVDAKSALWIGVAQGCAIAPGISRSGATIGTALLLGIKPKDAAEFSFLIGIPAMTIASVLTFLEEPVSGTGFAPLLVAIIAAFIAGYASIGLFMKWLQENRLYYFAIYCVVAGSIFATLFYRWDTKTVCYWRVVARQMQQSRKAVHRDHSKNPILLALEIPLV